MNAKIIALIVTAVIVVAGVGVFFLYGGDKSGPVSVDASLSIMGNADENATIDSDDLNIINDIISGDKAFSDYPLADVNNDKKVDSSDATAMQKMIGREPMKIYVMCRNASGEAYPQAIDYPLTKTVVVGTNLISTIIQVGAAEYVKGYTKTNYGVAHAPVLENAKGLNGTMFDLNTDDSKTAFNNLDIAVGGLDAVITMPSASYLRTSEQYISAAGIPVLRIDSSDGLDAIGGALTLGYIFGKNTEETAFNYAEKSYEILNYITDKVSGIKESEKKTFMAITMGYYISETDSPYTGVCAYSGGTTVSTLQGDGSVKIEEGQENYMNWNPDYIISFRTLDYSINYTDITTGTTLTPAQTWNNYAKYFSNMGDSYKNMIYVNCSMPVIYRIAYIAEIFYPDLFDAGYADKAHQEFVDEFMGYLGDFDVTKDMACLITYSDVVS
ncbi:MAG: hypothetical protein LBR42_04550 [Candidatus Methanoplasma sp.]|jgi:hypothetical protein|nr:hypothetical protein [Candidatus Methanoplasma sp.]